VAEDHRGSPPGAADGRDGLVISERQEQVLRAVVTAYVGDATPVGSVTVSHLLSVPLSSASIRNTMAELAELGLLSKPHSSAGRIPTPLGLRVFVDQLVGARPVEEFERRDLAGSLGSAQGDTVLRLASDLLSQRTRQLGFVVAPRLARVALRHVSFVRLSTERVLAVLVSQTGVAYRRILEDAGRDDQAELDRIATGLNERIVGRTLPEARDALAREARQLRFQADRLRERTLALAARALAEVPLDAADVVIGTWLALLDQPEFRDPERLRELMQAIEARERLVAILDQLLPAGRAGVAFGDEIGEPGLRRCALVVAPYGGTASPLGLLGVLGPSRMDYGRIIPFVDTLSRLMTERLCA
jgi:heat-inducible transcriptional repressor